MPLRVPQPGGNHLRALVFPVSVWLREPGP
jgi:hypothetical protein